MTTRFPRTRIATAVGGVILMLGASAAFGAAFALQENSGSGLGNAFAGGAAAAEDASTVWFNPAGMSRIGTNQVASAIHLIGPSAKFSDDGSRAAAQQPLGGDGGDAGSWAVVPNLYLVVPINRLWAFGIGLNAPFGLVTEYDNTWIGRYQAIKSDVRTINVNPAVSYKIDNFTVAAGANYQHIKATFTSKINYSGGLAQAAAAAAAGGQIPPSAVAPFLALTTGLDASANISGTDDAWGWNVGALWDISTSSRLGVHYRSSIKYTVTANAEISTPSLPPLPATLAPIGAALANAVNAQLTNSGVTAKIELPPIANLSYFRTLNDRWDVMADAQWTGWSSIKDLTFVRNNGTTLSSTPENFKDVWRFSVGANYRYSDKWMFRGGVAYDQSPVRDEFRTPRLPDSDRTWLSLGTQYKWSPALKLDVGATYILVKDGSINKNGDPPSTASYGLLKGNYSNDVVIVSGQVTYSF